ncbi:DUF1214 domain-containing protein [Lichenihabitans psoromatis]|uniref:DUF1214 domain-containing protein n=1 Tax=Lichenihabitans psoromatis TaxID=2528642 RepID=UPI001035FBC5|nr:DUF1214 domain-containing protein [Lichenihabitans psoromatis]
MLGSRLARLVKFVLAVAGGTALGLGATYVACIGQPVVGAVHSGVWTAWPAAGSTQPDPYAKAIFAKHGRIPLAAASGLQFLATTDQDGAALTARCTYSVAGPTPVAQFWTLTLLDPRGGLPDQSPTPPLVRAGFTSAELLRGADGGFTIKVARAARPGNWLPAPATGRFILMLSFYDTPPSAALLGGGPVPALPTVVKTACD